MTHTDRTNGQRTILIADRELPVRVGLHTILSGEADLLVPAPASTIKELTALEIGRAHV